MQCRYSAVGETIKPEEAVEQEIPQTPAEQVVVETEQIKKDTTEAVVTQAVDVKSEETVDELATVEMQIDRPEKQGI